MPIACRLVLDKREAMTGQNKLRALTIRDRARKSAEAAAQPRVEVNNPADTKASATPVEALSSQPRLPLQGVVRLLLAVLIVFPISLLVYKELTMTPAERAVLSDQQRIRRVAREAETAKLAKLRRAEQAKQGEEAREKARFKCLSPWDGSMSAFIDEVKETLRDPSSFDHVKTFASTVNLDGSQYITMQFRARNGFGGLNIGIAKATIRNDNCVIARWAML